MSAATATAIRPADAPARDDDHRRDRAFAVAAVAIPTVLAVALCVYEISVRSLWLDEAAAVTIASQHGSAFGAALAHDGGNMLGYYALLHVLIGAFGKGALVIRLPSVVGAGATVCVAGLIGLRLFGRRVAFAAGLLAAVSLPLVYWGQNARGYALMVALIAGSFLALVIALQSDRRVGAWIAYAVLMVAAVYAGLEAVLVIPAQLIAVLWLRHRVRRFALAVAVIAACCVPLAILASNRGSGQLFWVPPLSLTTAKQVVQALASTGLQPNFYTDTGTALLVLTGVVLLIGVGRICLILSRRDERRAAWGPALVLAWLVVPFVLALLESAVGQSIFQARYLLVSLPAVAQLLAWALVGREIPGAAHIGGGARIRGAARIPGGARIPAVLAVTAVAALIALRALQLGPAYGVSPENWRAATSYVLAHAGAADCVAFYPLDNRMPFQYYLGSNAATAPRSVLPAAPWGQAHAYVEDYATLSASQVSALRSRCARVWLITSHEGTVGGPPISRLNYVRLRTLVGALGHEYPHASTRSFGTAKTVALTVFTGAA
jgi:mannosyltransferase